MPFQRPVLNELVSRIESDILSRVETGVGILRRSILKVLARVFGAAIHLTYGYLDFMAKQLIVTTAGTEWLEYHAFKWGKTRKQATYSTGNANVTGLNGSIIPEGTSYFNAEGIEYETAAEVMIAAGVGVIEVTAKTPGLAGNQVEGDILTLGSPITGVDAMALVDADGLQGGEDTESDEDLRNRILHQIQNSSMGGNEEDFIGWALDTPSLGVTRVWVFPDYLGAGSLGVFFVLDNQSPIFPNPANIEQVQAVLDSHKELTQKVLVYSPVEKVISIKMQISPSTPAVQEAVRDSLVAMFRENTGTGEMVIRSQLDEAISLATGEVDHTITEILVNGTEIPVGNIEMAFNELPTIARADITFE